MENKHQSGASAILFGTGEYTTGYVHNKGTTSDKSAGVVALSFFDLRSRGKLGDRIGLCGTNGKKMPGIRTHMKTKIDDVYTGLSSKCVTFPADGKIDRKAYIEALKSFNPGDIAVVTTPDDTHFALTMAAIEAGLHVMVTKPLVKTLEQHIQIVKAAERKNVLVCLEYHKRYDPIYNDAVNRIKGLGEFGYFYSYMSQPKTQLQTFKHWAGKSSDISYYLNSHHIDIHEWAMDGIARPIRVVAMAATGVCKKEIGVDAEDTITLTTQWKNMKSNNIGVATYTSSWGTPKTDVHSEQGFFYMGHKGQIKIDQAHRGFYLATDKDGFASINPLYMRYTPDSQGRFVGQNGYGVRSFEVFVDAVNQIRSGEVEPKDFNGVLPTAKSCMLSTAILEAGRRSLDSGGRSISIKYANDGYPESIGFTSFL